MRLLTTTALVIIVCYVFVLNSILVNLLYTKYLSFFHMNLSELSSMPLESKLWRRGKAFPLFNTSLQKPVLQMSQMSANDHTMTDHDSNSGSKCTLSMQLVIMVSNLEHKHSNDITKQITLLTKMRGLLKEDRNSNIHMYLAVDVNSFMPVHRSLCVNIPRCSLMVTESNSVAQIFQHVSRIKPCIHDIVLINDDVGIDSTFFMRLARTDENKVTCLQTSAMTDTCPAIAYRIPRLFFTRHQTQDVDIMSTAAITGMIAPSIAVVFHRHK